MVITHRRSEEDTRPAKEDQAECNCLQATTMVGQLGEAAP